MAHPGDEPLDDVVEALKKLGAQTEATRKAVDDAKREAARTGGTIVPTTRAPTVVATVKESKQIIAAAQAESAAHASLARAIEAHETARLRLADARRRLKAMEGQSTPESTLASGRLQREIDQMRQQTAGLLRDVDIKRGTLTGLVGQETARGYEQGYRQQFREIVKEKLRSENEQTAATQRGAADRTRAVAEEVRKQQFEVRKLQRGFGVANVDTGEFRMLPSGRKRYFTAEHVAEAHAKAASEGLEYESAEYKRRVKELSAVQQAANREAGDRERAELEQRTRDLEPIYRKAHEAAAAEGLERGKPDYNRRVSALVESLKKEGDAHADAEKAKTAVTETETARRIDIEGNRTRTLARIVEAGEEGLRFRRGEPGQDQLRQLAAAGQIERTGPGTYRATEAGREAASIEGLTKALERHISMRDRLNEAVERRRAAGEPVSMDTVASLSGQRQVIAEVEAEIERSKQVHAAAEEAKTQKTQQESQKRAQAEQAAAALPEGPAAMEQRIAQREATQKAAWDEEMERFQAREAARAAPEVSTDAEVKGIERLRTALQAHEESLEKVRAAKARMAAVDPLRGDTQAEVKLQQANAAMRRTLEQVQLARLAIESGEGAGLKQRLAPTEGLTRQLREEIRAARPAPPPPERERLSAEEIRRRVSESPRRPLVESTGRTVAGLQAIFRATDQIADLLDNEVAIHRAYNSRLKEMFDRFELREAKPGKFGIYDTEQEKFGRERYGSIGTTGRAEAGMRTAVSRAMEETPESRALKDLNTALGRLSPELQNLRTAMLQAQRAAAVPQIEPIRFDAAAMSRAVASAVEPLMVQRTAPFTRGEMIQQGQVRLAEQRRLDEKDPTRPIQRQLDEARAENERLEREYENLRRAKFSRTKIMPEGLYRGPEGMEIQRGAGATPWAVSREAEGGGRETLGTFRTFREAQEAGREFARQMSHDTAEALGSQERYIHRLQDEMGKALADIERQARRTAAVTAAAAGAPPTPPPTQPPTAVAPEEPEPERRRPRYTPIDRPFTYPEDAAERARRIDVLRNNTSLADSARALTRRFDEAAQAADRARLPTREGARRDIEFGRQAWERPLGLTGEPPEFRAPSSRLLGRAAAAADIGDIRDPADFRRNIRESFAGGGDVLAQRLAPAIRSQTAAAGALSALTAVVRASGLRQAEAMAGPTQAESARALTERLRQRPLEPRPTAGGGGRAVTSFIDEVLRDPAAAVGRQFRSLAESSQILNERLEQSRDAYEREQEARRRAEQVVPLRREPPYTPIPGAPAPPGAPPPPPPPTAPGPPPPPPPPARPIVFGHERPTSAEAQAILAGTKRADEALESYNKTVRRSIQIEREHAAEMQASRVEQSRAIAQYGALSNAYRAHGAATTEFLAALGRGDASIREVGWQALATAGKFAAWTTASFGVFGAMAGLAKVGQGAIESMSGINELSRYITDLNTEQAQRQFRDLSAEFNLPIEDVTQAFAQMGRVFGNQEGAFQGARAVLLATRVGNLEVADSARFLSAIFQGFQIPAQQTTQVIDQINAAQNNLNFSIRDGSAGIARAAGSWKAAGGTFSELLAIMATAQRATGATGEVVGTAFRRSAEFVGREANQAQLRGFGIDTSRGIDEIYRQAFAAVERGAVKGQDITKLATALASPQLAAVISPTLQSFERYREALRETNAEAARGSARNELAIQLDAIRERISAVGNQLERLGSNLAQSGLLSGLVLMLETINLSLTAANNLLEAFNELPGPLKAVIAGFTQAYAVMRLMRRLNVGTFLTENAAAGGGRYAQGLRPLGEAITGDPVRATFKRALTSLTEEMAFFRAESERLGRTTAMRSTAQVAAKRRVEEFGRRGPDFSGLDLSTTEGQQKKLARIQQHDIEINRLKAVSDKTAEDRMLAAQDELATNQHLVAIEKRNAEIRKIGAKDARAGLTALEATGVTPVPVAGYVPSAERPTEARVTDFGGGVVPIAGVQTQASDAVEKELLASRAAVARGAAEGAEAAGAGAGAVAASGTRVNRASTRVRAAGRGLSLALRGLGAAAVAFLPELAIIGGLVFGPQIYNKIKENQRKQREKMDRLSQTAAALTEGGYQEQLKDAQKIADDRLERERKAQAEVERARKVPGTPISVETQITARGGDRFPDEQQAIDFMNAEAERQRRIAQAREDQRKAFARQRQTGLPQEIPFVPYQELEEIFQDLPAALANLGRGVDATAGAAALMRQFGGAISTSLEAEISRAPLETIIGGRSRESVLKEARGLGIGPEVVMDDATVEQIAQAIKDRARGIIAAADRQLRESLTTALAPGDVLAFDASRSFAEISTQLGTEVLAIQALGGSRDRFQKAGILYSQAVMHFGERQDPDALKALVEARQTLEQALTAGAQEIVRDLAAATTPRQRSRIFQRGVVSLRGQTAGQRRTVTAATTGEAEAQRAYDAAVERRDAVKERVKGFQGKFDFDYGGLVQGLDLTSGLKQAEADVAAAGVLLDAKKQELEDAKAALREGLKLTNEQIASVVGSFLDQDVLQQSRTRLKKARTGDDTVAAARVDRNAANRYLAEVQKLGQGNESFRRSAQYQTLLNNARAGALEAQTALDNAIKNGAQDAMEQLSLMQSRSALAVSALPTEGGARGQAILYGPNGLYAQLGAAKKAGADEQTINGIQTEINDQLRSNGEDAKGYAEDQRQKQRDRISAQYDYLRSLTDNPIRLAKLDELEAKALGGVGGEPEDKLRDRAAINEARRNKEQAIRDRAVENLEYRHDIGKLTDEAYISGLEKILRGMDKGTEAYRQFRMKIGRLKHDVDNADANFPQLDVGRIRLPTAYDIKRLVRQGTETRGGGGSSNNSVSQSNTYNFAVRSEADVDAIGGHLEQIHGTTVRSGMRAAGMRG